jgi:hypothetical protein
MCRGAAVTPRDDTVATCRAAEALANSTGDDDAVDDASCKGRFCRRPQVAARCEDGDARACVEDGDEKQACRLGHKASCFALALDAPTDKAVLDMACTAGASAACTLARLAAPRRTISTELNPPATAVFEGGDFVERSGTAPTLRPGDTAVVRVLRYNTRGELIDVDFYHHMLVDTRRVRVWLTVGRRQPDAPRMIESELVVVADADGRARE